MVDVISAGILIADTFASPIARLPDAGELALVDSYVMGAGGCAANTAACLARLGRKVAVIGKTGQDLPGDFVLSDLTRLGIDASAVRRSPTHPTSTTYIVNVEGQDRRYFHCIGANADFSLRDIDISTLSAARALYVGGYLVMPGWQPNDLATLFREAKRRGLMTVLDVVIGTGTRVSLASVEPALPYTDLFLPNHDEARSLTGRDDPSSQAEMLSRLNPDCTIAITLGRRGVFVRSGRRTFGAGAYSVEAIDESGAGDAFTAGFITGMLEQWPLEQTIGFASAAGASCTRALGCTAGVFRFQEALEFTAANKLEISIQNTQA
ncbi:MAG TPA: carbohydrate kinase family protein [Terriglobia bacterium]|nr:carbohydrate kinase family protein [Terriglobia bacterium]